MSDLESLVRGFFERAINAHDVEACGRYCSDSYIWHGPTGDVSGLRAFKSELAAFFHAFPDVHAELLDVISRRDRLAIRYRETGTHSADFMGLPATGITAAWEGMAIYRASHSLLVEEWSVVDALSLLRQIGGLPAS
jgi:predicted ester cyclase